MRVNCRITNFASDAPMCHFEIDQEDAYCSLQSEVVKYLRRHPVDPFDVQDRWQAISFKDKDNNILVTDQDILGVNGRIFVSIRNYYTQRIPTQTGTWRTVSFHIFEANQVKLGHFISNREKGPLDDLPVDLSTFSSNVNSIRNVEIVVNLWKHMTDVDESCNWIMDMDERLNPKYTYVQDPKCIVSLRQRRNEQDTLKNIIAGDTQIGT